MTEFFFKTKTPKKDTPQKLKGFSENCKAYMKWAYKVCNEIQMKGALK